MWILFYVFSDQSIDDSCKKSDDIDQEYAIVESVTRKHDRLWYVIWTLQNKYHVY